MTSRETPVRAREMLLRHDWVVPLFNDELRAHKPVLLYWCIMSSYLALGVNEFAARLPSALRDWNGDLRLSDGPPAVLVRRRACGPAFRSPPA